MSKIRRVKLLRAYRRAGLGLATAYERLDSYRQKHNPRG